VNEIRIPSVVIPTDPKESIVTVGIPDMTFDGAPFPFETMGDWSLTFSKDGAAALTVTIPVLIARGDDE
jgi:hypothetical protein